MGDVISFRLSEDEKKIIEDLAEEENRDRSDVARELIRYGEIYRAIKLYRQGKISAGKMASELDMNIAEAMDLLAEFGVTANIDMDEYLQAEENLEEVW